MPDVTRPLLVRRPRPATPEPRWDEAARRVLAHRAGLLRVLGGPGTGKTTVLVESVLRRIRAGVDPERLLVLVGSRRAAGELRERLTARLGDGSGPGFGTVREPLVRTVHSYAFGLLRLHATRIGDPPPRLLAGPEQDAVVRELLAGELAGDVPGSGWPDRLRPALGVPGFATELRELLLRAAERGLGPYELAELGAREDMPEWVAAGRFFLGYEQVNLLRGAAGGGAQGSSAALDAAELVAAALDVLAADPELLAAERTRIRHLLADDAQDLDPQQMQLVRLLGETAETFLLAGDPDQAVLGFRGADPSALRDADPGGRATVVLTADHRAAPRLRQATSRLAARLPGAGAARRRTGPVEDSAAPAGSPPVGPADGGAEQVGPADGGVGEGALAVQVFASAAQEAGWVADRLRRAHLTDGVPWSEMAVLVRSTTRSLPVLRRAMLAAGVPMAVPGDELPLSRQPAVLPLLLLLRSAARPEQIDADAAVALLSSPLGAADPLRLRRLRRGLLRLHAAGIEAAGAEELVGADDPPASRGFRQGESGISSAGKHVGSESEDEELDGDGGDRDGGSDELLVAALRAGAAGETDPLPTLPARDTAPLRRVAELLGLARSADREGASAEEVLWRLWQASGLAGRWAAASAHPGPAGAQADRDLDAVVALFDAAARYTDRLPGGGSVEGFAQYVADQRIPGDSLAPRAPQGEAVAVLTAHAARGREWRVVAVPSVQEGSWPDLRLRGTLLGVERMVDALDGLGGAAALSKVAPLLAEERRLFYLACSRAGERLYVSAVRGEDEQPSRFLDELDPEPIADEPDAARPVTRPPRALVLAELVGELRRAVCAPVAAGEVEGEERRQRAAAQLARLAAAGVRGAHPNDWYGLAPMSTDEPLRDPAQPVPVSPSDVEKIMKCPLKWVLERHGGDDGAVLPSVTGSLVHALVQATAAGATEPEVDLALRRAWSAVDAGAPWFGRRELDRVRGMLTAFRTWMADSRRGGLTEVDVERGLELALAGGADGPDVVLRGRVDRLERDAEGRPVIVDVKTGKTAVSREDAEAHPQLAVYQLAAALGAFRDALGGPAGVSGVVPGGARLLFLADRGADGRAKERTQPALTEDDVRTWRRELHGAARATGAAEFTARENADCERCGVRTSCPVTGDGRGVPSG
ncbi:MAG TPA: ATP-dependent DNA helicase [Pseudonocardia sp.]|jgi:superfamily I DNA/RNA helicase/RecB family exonuclease|nr:ATP-dependent DNA helicase [Pseudonocardia sp.]